jgi:hypothetical protein
MIQVSLAPLKAALGLKQTITKWPTALWGARFLSVALRLMREKNRFVGQTVLSALVALPVAPRVAGPVVLRAIGAPIIMKRAKKRSRANLGLLSENFLLILHLSGLRFPEEISLLPLEQNESFALVRAVLKMD